MSKTTTLFAITAGCVFGVISCATSAPNALEQTEFGLIAEVEIGAGSSRNYRMILDTGAAMSVLNAAGELPDNLALVQEVNVAANTGARTRAGIYRSGFMRFGANEFDEALFLVIDLSDRPGPFVNGIDGILSPRLITSGYLEIDFATASYRIHEAIEPTWGVSTPFAENSLPVAVIDVAGQPVEVLLDSGASGFLLLPASMVESLPLETPPSASGNIATVNSDATVTNAQLAGNVSISGHIIRNPTLEFADDIEQPLLGLAGLSSYRLVLDSVGQQSWLVPGDAE
jgi:predicted aspartyl protease